MVPASKTTNLGGIGVSKMISEKSHAGKTERTRRRDERRQNTKKTKAQRVMGTYIAKGAKKAFKVDASKDCEDEFRLKVGFGRVSLVKYAG